MLNVKKLLTKLLTIESGTATKSNANISSVEFAYWYKCGRVVVLRLNFTVGTAISDSTATLFTDIPKAYAPIRSTVCKVNAVSAGNIIARLEVNDTSIKNAYTSGGIPAAQYEGEIVYFTKA